MIECDQNQACVDKVAEKYKAIDDIQDQALADCRTIACVEIHIKLIQGLYENGGKKDQQRADDSCGRHPEAHF